jgi:hypothetical protein
MDSTVEQKIIIDNTLDEIEQYCLDGYNTQDSQDYTEFYEYVKLCEKNKD